jgi:hypothetical protein
MSTKLYIPYQVKSLKDDSQFLLVFSPLKLVPLASGLLSKLLIKGISTKEYLALFWLATRLKSKQEAAIYYSLALWGEIPAKGRNNIYGRFPDWFWPHSKIQEAFPQLRGDLKSQLKRNLKNLKISFKVETRRNVTPREISRIGVGYRDKGNLPDYSFDWRDVPTDPEKVLFQDLLARNKDRLFTLQTKKARIDLDIFLKKSGRPAPRKKGANLTEEIQGKDRNFQKITKSEKLIRILNLRITGN